MSAEDQGILAEQIAYYRARAAEYDEWFLRQGRYDHGDEHRRLWFDEVATVEAALGGAEPGGDVLELACGTGIWTRRLALRATTLTAVDTSSEVIAINRSRLQSANVRYVEADIFRWVPLATYDFIFFAFWLSHVPRERFDQFWGMVQRALRPSGRVFFVDSRAAPEGTARDQKVDSGGVVARRLNDGRLFRIVKIFHEPGDLTTRLTELGWAADVEATSNFFIYGTACAGAASSRPPARRPRREPPPNSRA